MLREINEKEFKEKVSIRFNNINEGFYRFNNKVLICDEVENVEEKVIAFIEKCFELNGEKNSYVDFYYNAIDNDAKKRFEQLLCDKDRDFIDRFKNQCRNKGVYYKLSKESIPFITRLNLNEILFCTVYFTKNPMTLWGNYNKKFPVFYIEENTFKIYEIIAKNNKLIIK